MVAQAEPAPTSDSSIFRRVVCGVDRSPESLVAVRTAARVADPAGEVEVVTVRDSLADDLEERTLTDEVMAAGLAGDAAPAAALPALRSVEGQPIDGLLREIRRRAATLAVVGTHGWSRVAGIVRGSVATHVLHDAPCSVLIAREHRGSNWPRSIVVGVDGSPPSIAASVAARDLALRVGASVRFVAAAADPHVELENARLFVPELEILDGRAVDELHVLSERADLIVVGSRGLRGILALGSVGERVAHEARSSVLVVRV